ncbi:hypothetical protein QBC46DRAFT_25011 [Diplogelasinospora grovesii]|uniref:Asl1-like glycosyl hydrolase catalytic domain-containing protein n=1 Tax=Diplogelasinospora grovesii TaxID=303347 RepID=A0AAN6S1R3_9PEZI|nr:hypothetical protein QBC46DRAFT_25011 [Diplogelasinospora grovesii]
MSSSLSRALLGSAALLATLLAKPAAASWPKRGLAANEDIPIWQFGGSWEGNPSQVNWQYNWGSTTSQKQSFAEYVPMLWGLGSDHTGVWSDNAWYWLVNGGSGHLLGFNEPEQTSQSNISPQDAANAYRTYFTPFIGHAQIGSPAVSNDGYAWMQQFLSACSDCGINFLAIHWYNDYTQVDDFKNWVNSMCALGGGKQVWITEFEGYGTVDEQSAFLKAVIPWLDDNDCVYRYAYFGTADPDQVLLQNGGPALSPIGVQYTFTPYGG